MYRYAEEVLRDPFNLKLGSFCGSACSLIALQNMPMSVLQHGYIDAIWIKKYED